MEQHWRGSGQQQIMAGFKGRAPVLCSIITVLFGAVGLTGWIVNRPILGSFGSRYIPMSPNVALAFILLGMGLFFQLTGSSSRSARVSLLSIALLVSFVAIANLISFLTGFQTGVEELFPRQILSLDSRRYGAGPMSPLAAGNFLLDCAAVVLLLRAAPVSRRMSGYLSSLALGTNIVILLGYLYGTPLLYGGGIRPIALPVAIAFVFFNVGIVSSVGSAHFPLKYLAGSSVHALMLRTFLFVILVVSVTDGVAYQVLSRLQFNQALLSALSALIYIGVGSVVISQIAGVIGGAMDRAETQRRKAEEELRKNRDHLEELVQERTADLVRSNAELEQFAYVASHDLKEPLLSVSAYLKLLERRIKDKLNPEAEKFLTGAIDTATRMQALIGDLLVYSRAGRADRSFEPTDANRILGVVLSDLKTSLEQTRAVITSDRLPEVMADPSQLTQLFQNLLANAIKFFAGDRPVVHVSAKPVGRGWLFSIRDNGIGIPSEESEQIFEVFHRAHRDKFSGTGIGLATCKKIVERHGGRIWVESQPGNGSTFYFTIGQKERSPASGEG